MYVVHHCKSTELQRDPRKKTQYPKLHFGRGSFDRERSKVKGYFFHVGGFLTAKFTTMHNEAVHEIFLCFLEVAQNANLKIAFLSAGLFTLPALHNYILLHVAYI